MSSRENLNILEALDNLATLVEIDSLDDIEITEHSQIIAHPHIEKPESNQEKEESYWIGARADDQTIDAVKETFRVVYHYLKNSYNKAHGHKDTKRLVEGINTIMVLVGEAAKKLERFSNIFEEKITTLKEYKDLQDFYRNKVIKESFQEFAKKTIPLEEVKEVEFVDESDIAQEALPSTIYVLDDIQTVKKDTHYELFYLGNEEGRNFYTHELVRNIKVACDFGEFTKEYFGDDPLLQIKNWEDKSLQIVSKNIIEQNKKLIENYFKEAMSYKNMELVALMNQTLIALMLASNPRNLIRQFASKTCHRYFADFQMFLREVLMSREYQKLLIYSAPTSKPFFVTILDLVQSLCMGLYLTKKSEGELEGVFKDLITRSDSKVFDINPLSEFLYTANKNFEHALKHHPNGPLFKALDIVREEEKRIFDPIMQDNIPTEQVILKGKEFECSILRMPAPIKQEFINKAALVDEFKGFLRAYIHRGEGFKHLVFNFQDRTSWKDHARSIVVEELQRNAEFAKTLFVITLPKDTDFYWQIGEYAELDSAGLFLDQLRMQIEDEATGYYFTPSVRKLLLPEFISTLTQKIYTSFFKNKKTLNYQERLNFIELVYLGIELKLLSEIKPNSVSFMSKDSLDVGCCETVSFIEFLKLYKKKEWKIEDKEKLLIMLFGPALIVRERGIHFERFERMNAFIEFLESHSESIAQLESLFSKELLKSEIKT